jgi:Ni/Co efflux regulator RcnB
MKSRLLVSAAILALIAASPALADRNDKNDSSTDNAPRASHDAGAPRGEHRDQGAPAPNAAPSGGGMNGGRHDQGGAAPAVAPSGGGMARTPHRTRSDTGAMSPTTGATRRDNAPNTMARPNRRGTANVRTNPGTNAIAPRSGAVGTGAHVHNPAFNSMHRAFTAPRRFQFGVYNRPSGWYSHRWTFGEFLPSFFFSRNYWILDWEDFALDNPPPGTVWVRYGDDALLIDEYSGEVIEVEYGIFY